MTKTTVLITGANSGVGYAATKVITTVSEKYHVIMACRNLEKAETAKTEIEATGIKGTISIVYLDVTKQKSIDEAAESVEKEFGKLDVLVNNAAIGSTDPDTRTRFEISMANNVIGPACVAAAFRPLLLKSNNPYSLWITSGVGSFANAAEQYGIKRGEAYRASKSALNMIAVQEWYEFKDQGLKTFAVCPGFVVSNLRGTSEEARTGRGMAGDPMVSGQLILDVFEGRRDADVGRVVKSDGIWEW